MGNKAAFIDRDGTINANIGYIDNPDSFKMHSGVAEGIKLLNKDGFKVIIITNQSGIARGFFTEKTLLLCSPYFGANLSFLLSLII